MTKLARLFYSLFFLLLTLPAMAQPEDVEMADAMRADGKIYVIVAIVLVVLAGLIFYLFLLDRKISRLERDGDDKNQRTNL